MNEKIDKTNAVFAIQTYNCKLKKNKRSKLAQQHYKVDMNGSEWPYIGNYASELHLIKDKDNTLFERNKTTFYGTLNLWRTRVSTDTEEYLSRVETCQMQLHPGFPRWQRDSLARLDTYLSATYADPGICSLSHANKGGNSQQWTRGGGARYLVKWFTWAFCSYICVPPAFCGFQDSFVLFTPVSFHSLRVTPAILGRAIGLVFSQNSIHPCRIFQQILKESFIPGSQTRQSKTKGDTALNVSIATRKIFRIFTKK